MALRYKIPAGFGAAFPQTELRVPPALREPVVVEFRRGANLKEVAADISQYVSVKVDAAVGAGKSTQLPSELALRREALVFHVVPNPILAYELHKYVVKRANDAGQGMELMLYDSIEQRLPKIGVVFVGCAQFVAYLIKKRSLSEHKSCVVFLDEAHESDAYTHVVRNLSLALGAGVLVQASATFSGASSRPRESVGEVVLSTYAAEDVIEGWSPTHANKPWGYAKIKNNVIIYTDSRSQCKVLDLEYSTYGFSVYRLEADMKVSDYEEAMKVFRDPRGPSVLLMADYSFRSGFTFNVGTILDSGRVSYYDPTPGVLAKRSRSIYRFEAEQTAGRGGRLAGLVSKYYRPEGELEAIMCDLEGVEMEAAAYLYRVLGYRPVRELSGTVMGEYDLPASICFETAMNGLYPLSYYVIDGKGQPRRDAVLVGEPTVVPSEKVTTGQECFAESEDTTEVDEEEEAYSADVYDDMWRAVREAAEGAKVTVPLGTPLVVKGLKMQGEYSITFPRGAESVMRLFGDGKIPVSSMSSEDREAAMRLLLARYNVCAVEVAAAGAAILSCSKEIVQACDSDVAAARYFAKSVEAVAAFDLEMTGLYSLLERVAGRKYALQELRGTSEFIRDRKYKYVSEFKRVLEHSHYSGADVEYQLGEALRGLPAFGRPRADVRFSSSLHIEGAPGVPETRHLGEVGKRGIRHKRRKSSSASSGSSGGSQPLTIRPPRWMGFKTVTYIPDADGEVVGAVVRPGKVLRGLGAPREWHRGDT